MLINRLTLLNHLLRTLIHKLSTPYTMPSRFGVTLAFILIYGRLHAMCAKSTAFEKLFSIFTKSYNSAKYKKVTQSCPKTEGGVGKITVVTLFAGELVVWRRQLAQMCALVGPRCKKIAQRASQRPEIQTKTWKTQKNLPRRSPKTTQRWKRARNFYARQQKHNITS